MGFANNKIAKVWEVKPKEKYTEVKLSTSKKVLGENGQYERDFSSFVRFIGKAHKKCKELQDGELIKLLEVETSNNYDTARKQMYYNFVCWDFEKTEFNKNNNTKASQPADDLDDDELPF